MAAAQGLVIAVLLALCLKSNAQFEDLGECIADDDFLANAIGCLMAKFEPLLELNMPLRYSETQDDHEFTGRHLLFSHADDVLVKSNMPKMVKRATASGGSFMAKIQSVVSNFKDDLIRSEILPSIKQLSLKDLGMKAGRYLAKNLIGTKDTAIITKRLLSSLADRLGDLNLDDLLKKGKTSEGSLVAIDVCTIFGEGPLCDLYRIGQCLQGYPEEAFEDGIEWVQCLFVCDDLPPMATCMAEAFNKSDSCRRLDWMESLIMRIFVDVVQLNNCFFVVNDVKDVTVDNPINLEEGAEAREMEFTTYLPPGVLCVEPGMLNSPISLIIDVISGVFNLSAPCDVQIQMSTTNYMHDLLPYIDFLGINIGRPKCRDDAVMHQAAIGWSEHASNYSCVIKVTPENWNSTFKVPVSATVDGKADKNIALNFTLKMVANGETLNTTKIPITIVNTDSPRTATCQSVNDPHMLTFDGHHYNNFYHGYFYLYKHSNFPYEVQAIYQSCSDNVTESCNCAVAVRSGDDVFVVDRCRRRSCASDDCQLMKATLFTNGQLTPGTRVFVKNGGLRYDVLLPHGTLIRIVASNDMLNTWITSSVFDRDNTSGLCGTFNDISSDDLTLPNGTVYTGDGSEEQGQPREFNQAWRVPEEEIIFSGVYSDEDASQPLEYCKCNHHIIQGIQCTCGYGELVEYCDIDTDGELTETNISSIMKRSALEVASLNGNFDILNEDEIDMDEDYEPKDIEWRPNGEWDLVLAQEYCDDFIKESDNPLIQKCITELGIRQAFAGKSVENCVEDIKITDTTEWALSALEAAKYYCRDSMDKKVNLRTADYDIFENGTCLSQCNGEGRCEFGKCICNAGYIGPDCGLPNRDPVLLMDNSAVCDSRYEDCSYATMHGLYFVDSVGLECFVTKYDALDGKLSNKEEWTSTFYISENQVACKLPESGSYRVSLSYNQKRVPLTGYNTDFIFMSYDSACYTCDLDTQRCSLREGYGFCLIKNECYASEQINTEDSCSVCNVTISTNKWTDVSSTECLAKRAAQKAKEDSDQEDLIIRSCIAAGLSSIIIIIVVVVFIIDRRTQKKRRMLKQSESVTPDELDAGHQNNKAGNDQTTTSFGGVGGESLDQARHGVQKTNGSVDNQAFEISEEPTRVSVECAEVLRIKAQVAGRRQRTTSQSSVQSHGSVSSFFRAENIAHERIRTTSGSSAHSGAGPVHLSSNLPNVDNEDSEVHGIGGYMTGVLTPSGRRKDYQHINIARF